MGTSPFSEDLQLGIVEIQCSHCLGTYASVINFNATLSHKKIRKGYQMCENIKYITMYN